MEDPKEIARKLTKAQREAMRWLYGPHLGKPQRRQWHAGKHFGDPAAAAFGALERKDLVRKWGSAGWTIYYEPTLDGLAVREALLTPTREDQSHDG